MQSNEISKFQFGDLQFSVRGKGVFVGGKFVDEKCQSLDLCALKAANKEAWRQRKASEGVMNRCHNISLYGSSPYDNASFTYYVAEAACKSTWKRMQEVTA